MLVFAKGFEKYADKEYRINERLKGASMKVGDKVRYVRRDDMSNCLSLGDIVTITVIDTDMVELIGKGYYGVKPRPDWIGYQIVSKSCFEPIGESKFRSFIRRIFKF